MKDQDNKQLIKNSLNPIKTQARIGKGKNRNSWHRRGARRCRDARRLRRLRCRARRPPGCCSPRSRLRCSLRCHRSSRSQMPLG